MFNLAEAGALAVESTSIVEAWSKRYRYCLQWLESGHYRVGPEEVEKRAVTKPTHFG